MTAPEPTYTEQVAAWIAAAEKVAPMPTVAGEAYDGAIPDEYDGWSARDLGELADRRAGRNYFEGP